VSVGQDAVTGAASLVTRDVPDGKLAVGLPARIRERQPRPDEPTDLTATEPTGLTATEPLPAAALPEDAPGR